MYFKNILFLMLSLIVMSGCAGQKRILNKYYLIEKPEGNDFNLDLSQTAIPEYCEIATAEIYPAFASQKIAVRNKTHEIVYYSFHQWAVRPDESLTLLMEDYLTRNVVFKGVSTRFWKVTPAYHLKTTVYKLEIVDAEGKLFAHLALEWRLLNTKNELLVLHHFDHLEPLSQKDINLFARTVSSVFLKELSTFGGKIVKELPDQR